MPAAAPTVSADSLEKSANLTSAPKDFEAFWLATLQQLLAVAPTPHSVSLDLPAHGDSLIVEAKSLGGAPIRMWVSGHKNTRSAGSSRPLLVTSHGYGGEVDPERVRRLAKFGLDVVAVDMRGYGLSCSAIPEVSDQGYLLTGCSSKEESILRGAVCDYVQAYRAALSWFGAPSKVTFQGFSFAGGLAMMAAALLAMGRDVPGAPAVPQTLAPGAPTFGHLEQRLKLCRAGSGQELSDYLAAHPAKAEATMDVFQYFDTCFFAPYLTTEQGALKKIIMGIGIEDPVVPAETVYAIKNALPEEPQLHVLPCSHTDRPEEAEWVRWEGTWIRDARQSV